MQNRGLDPAGLANPSETRWLTDTGPRLDRLEAAGLVCRLFWN